MCHSHSCTDELTRAELRRLSFCNFFLEQNRTDANFRSQFLWTDSGNFSRYGMNTDFDRAWLPEGAPFPYIDERFKFKVNVWAGIIGGKVIGPHFMPEKQTSKNYVNFLKNDLKRLLDAAGVNINDIWFQQSGLQSHTSATAVKCITEMFGDRWIGNKGVDWPPNSNDLKPIHFFLWQHIELNLYSKHAPESIQNVDRLKALIVAEFNLLKSRPNEIAKLHDNMVERCNLCTEYRGKRFEKYLKSKYICYSKCY